MPNPAAGPPSAAAWRPMLAAVLILHVACPPLLLSQHPSPSPQSSSQTPSQIQTQPPSGTANEATSKPIDESPLAPMAPVQAALPANVSPLTQDEQILHVLNRFTYGPRPGDLEHLRAQGISRWLTDQLNPEHIDDRALAARLADYPAMKLPIGRLMELYPDNQMIRATMNGRGGVPFGQGERAIYNAQMDRYKERQKKGDAKPDPGDSTPASLPQDPQALLAMDPSARFNALCKYTPAQLVALRKLLAPADRERLTDGFTPHQVEIIAALNGPSGVVASEIVQTKILRDIYTERQLNEVMVDFWLNHFNVYIRKSQQAPYFITAYERDVIRPRALASFESLLVATAESPAMLNYLDNAESVGPHSASVNAPVFGGRFGRLQPPKQKKDTGLNENYARELMELHTLGVNGGYTQQDVTEVAKVFTGWTLGRGFGDRDGQAVHPEFDQSRHEPGAKTVLGVKIKENGVAEGMQVLHLLASSPQTAHFISTKLAIRFVSDTPPPALVDRMARTFLETHGDIRRVLIAMIQSPEFFSRDVFRAKVKTPQDFVLSAVRASGADVQSAGALAATIADLGMPFYGMQTPNGYSMRADPWNSTASLISRMNFALALSSDRVVGLRADLSAAAGQPLPAAQNLSPEQKEHLLEAGLLHLNVSDRTRQTILAQITADPDQQQASLKQIGTRNAGRDSLSTLRAAPHPESVADPQIALAAALLFGSPEFRRR